LIAGSLIGPGKAAAVYDHARRRRFAVGGVLTEGEVNVYDFDSGSGIVGRGFEGVFLLAHVPSRTYVELGIEGTEFRGTLQGSRTRFSGMRVASVVTLFDSDVKRMFVYSLLIRQS